MRIREPADITAALAASIENGGLLLDETQLGENFFDLGTGFAAEMLQRFTSYRAKLAVVVRDAGAYGSRFGELMYEHRTHGCVRFFDTPQHARQWLTYNPVTRC